VSVSASACLCLSVSVSVSVRPCVCERKQQAYTEKDMLRSPPGSSRLDDFANDVLNNRPPGRHRRRRDRQFGINDVFNGLCVCARK